MALLIPKKINLSAINNGNEFVEGDGVTVEAVNAPLEASAWVQMLGENQPVVEGEVGLPSVTIEQKADGTPFFRFRNIKGQQGAKGEKGEAGIQGEYSLLSYDNDYYISLRSRILYLANDTYNFSILHTSNGVTNTLTGRAFTIEIVEVYNGETTRYFAKINYVYIDIDDFRHELYYYGWLNSTDTIKISIGDIGNETLAYGYDIPSDYHPNYADWL